MYSGLVTLFSFLSSHSYVVNVRLTSRGPVRYPSLSTFFCPYHYRKLRRWLVSAAASTINLSPPIHPVRICVEIFNPLLLSHTINDSERNSPTSTPWQQWLLTIAKLHSLPAKTAQHRPPLSGDEMRLARCSVMPVAYSSSSTADLGR